MIRCFGALLGVLLPAVALAGTAADLAARVRQAELDPAECYRVRDVTLRREDVRLYFTDGYLIFTRPVDGMRLGAVFAADVEGGDAEIIVLPPDAGERRSLASFTGSPNLNEHFRAAVLTFTDDSEQELREQLAENPISRPNPEMGHVLAAKWSSPVRNLFASFETRIVLDLLSRNRRERGFLYAAISGSKLGNFDVVHDPRSTEEVTVGSVRHRDDRLYFDHWTSFPSRSSRQGAKRNGGWELDLSDYRIDATLQPPDLKLDVTTAVRLRPNGSKERVLPFEITAAMRITEVTVNGQPAEVLERESLRSNLIRNAGNHLFLVVTEEPLDPEKDHEVVLRHTGSVISDAGNQVYRVADRTSWYPSRGLQFSHYALTFRYPKHLQLVASGELASEEEDGDWKIDRRSTSQPIRVVGFNLGTYEKATLERAGVNIQVYANQSIEQALAPRPIPAIVMAPNPQPGRVRRPEIPIMLPTPPPPDPKARLRDLATEIASALEFMAARFGPPPSRELIVSPVPGTFGQGFAGMIYLSTLSYLSPRSRPVTQMNQTMQRFFLDILQAHETAHQWWGNVVANKHHRDEWLMEALANYSALLYLETQRGPKVLDEVLSEYRDNLLNKRPDGETIESTGPISFGARLVSSQSPDAWRTITYEKGSWILHMLRRRMGDERFWAMLKALCEEYAQRTITTDEFRLHAANFLPPRSGDAKLEAFFQQWVYSTGIPTFELKYKVEGRAPQLKLTGTVTQSGIDDGFSARIPIEISVGRGEPVVHWVRTSDEPAAFSVPLRQAPARVTLDPGGHILAVKR
ncbi:MAG: hypothetical protein IPM24_09180 [Bryobacterales bacterium]|nr:hypothetical protein [Bryobacterales bacterium]